jgi:hypothetical protein
MFMNSASGTSLIKLFLAGNTSAVDFRNGRFQENLKFQNIPGQKEFNQYVVTSQDSRLQWRRALIDIFNSAFSFSFLTFLQCMKNEDQGVTKRCCLYWLTNSALVYKPKCGEGGGVAKYRCAHGAQITLET